MKYYVKIGDGEYQVDIIEKGSELTGRLGGRAYRVEHAEIEEGSKYSIIIEGESFNVSLHRMPSTLDLIVGGHLYQAQVMDEREKGALALEEAKGLTGHQVVQSVMPGIVRRIFVAEGESVPAGAPLLILEAMKMENELCAEREGVVSKVHVSEGQTVNSSDPLVTID